ncbi:MAG: zinc ABC transporter substrate-binding protein [Erysipelotrichaceae bacterium]|nr:zinc ABC transporter substrate-binding protein [Erysipelotrichaceae bacterium]
MMLAAVLMIGCLAGCAQPTKPADKKPLQIVTTVFPVYDWVKQILGDAVENTEVTMLLDDGVDLHSYQPNVDDILKISTCDVFIYVGGESDEWVEDALKEAENKEMVVINLMDILGDKAKEEEIVEGMQEEEEEEPEEEIEYDEHVWLSLQNASFFVEEISDSLGSIDPGHADVYQQNAKAYMEQLKTLDQQYQDVVEQAEKKTLVFADRFPFRYLTDDYGLTYYAAFAGCSAETEASFDTITFLSKKVDELTLSTVLTIEGNNHRIAETVVENTRTKDQKILILDSMQAVTSEDVQNKTTYLSVMESNLEILKQALQ